MEDSDIGLLVLGALVLGLIALCGVLAARYGSLRGAMFGARIVRELGMIEGAGGTFSRCLKARVFELEAGGHARIGLELRMHGKRSYATLDAESARKLAGLLQAAAR